jgi:hypothetical protein
MRDTSVVCLFACVNSGDEAALLIRSSRRGCWHTMLISRKKYTITNESMHNDLLWFLRSRKKFDQYISLESRRRWLLISVTLYQVNIAQPWPIQVDALTVLVYRTQYLIQAGFKRTSPDVMYPPTTYSWTVPLILDQSYVIGKLTSSKIADTNVSEF